MTVFGTSAQTDSTFTKEALDTTHQVSRHGSPGGLIVVEAFLIGISYYASKPRASGDKVVGGLYAISAAALLAYTPFYWTNKKNNLDPDFKNDRIWNAVTMVGLGYGFSRIANYNLFNSDGHSFDRRFKRNLIESHTAYFIPIITGALIEKALSKKKQHNKVQTSLNLDMTSLHLTVRLK